MNVRAKMKCASVNKTEHSEEVTLDAVYSGDKNSEDNTYSQATPSAQLKMSVTNKSVHGAFVPGQKYYVDFTPAE